MAANMHSSKNQIRQIITPQLCLDVYNLKFPYPKGQLPDAGELGQTLFKPSPIFMQALYDLTYHSAILPLSQLPLDTLLAVDFTELLPDPDATNYPEQCLGMVILLDQAPRLSTGYGFRYARAFFDPLCVKLGLLFISLPIDRRPDGKQAWLSRGYSFEDWLVRMPWFWAPLSHSDSFMTEGRQQMRELLHNMRSEVEAHYDVRDPLAAFEHGDEIDINAFQKLEGPGPPTDSYIRPGSDASMADLAFWTVRLFKSQFATYDMCGHAPYWVRWGGLEWTDNDREWIEKNGSFRHDPETEAVLEEVRKDYVVGVWKPMPLNPRFERSTDNAV